MIGALALLHTVGHSSLALTDLERKTRIKEGNKVTLLYSSEKLIGRCVWLVSLIVFEGTKLSLNVG